MNRRAATISHSQGLAPRFPALPIPGLWRASSAEQRAMLEREYSLYVPASRCQSRPWIICGAPRPGLVRNAILKPPMDNMRRASWPATWGNRPAAHGFFAARRPESPSRPWSARTGAGCVGIAMRYGYAKAVKGSEAPFFLFRLDDKQSGTMRRDANEFIMSMKTRCYVSQIP